MDAAQEHLASCLDVLAVSRRMIHVGLQRAHRGPVLRAILEQLEINEGQRNKLVLANRAIGAYERHRRTRTIELCRVS